MSKTYVVIDTNVLISAFIKAGSVPAKVLLLVQTDKVIPVVSDKLLKEYRDVALRKKFWKYSAFPDIALFTIDRLVKVSKLIELSSIPAICTDPNDDMVLATAVAGEADYLVTGNIQDFPISPYGKLKILRPADFLLAIEGA